MQLAPVRHRRVTVDGIDTFYREAGPADGPVLLLPHGYPASSFVYRHLMAALGDWRTIAPDLPGFGYSATPSLADFGYTFRAYAEFLQSFVQTLNLQQYVIWLHDYGSQFGFQLALAKPNRVAGLIIQNGDIYADAFGPKYDFLKKIWDNRGPDARPRIAQHVTLAGFESELRGDLPDAPLHLLGGGHWLLETHFDEVVPLVADFLANIHAR